MKRPSNIFSQQFH